MTDSKLLGCIGPSQLKRISRNEWSQHSVQDLLAPFSPDNSVTSDTDTIQVLSLMRRTGNSRLMVVEGSQLVGVITLKDLFAFLALKMELEGSE
jgi:predicted transcriptional regulator